MNKIYPILLVLSLSMTSYWGCSHIDQVLRSPSATGFIGPDGRAIILYKEQQGDNKEQTILKICKKYKVLKFDSEIKGCDNSDVLKVIEYSSFEELKKRLMGAVSKMPLDYLKPELARELKIYRLDIMAVEKRIKNMKNVSEEINVFLKKFAFYKGSEYLVIEDVRKHSLQRESHLNRFHLLKAKPLSADSPINLKEQEELIEFIMENSSGKTSGSLRASVNEELSLVGRKIKYLEEEITAKEMSINNYTNDGGGVTVSELKGLRKELQNLKTSRQYKLKMLKMMSQVNLDLISSIINIELERQRDLQEFNDFTSAHTHRGHKTFDSLRESYAELKTSIKDLEDQIETKKNDDKIISKKIQDSILKLAENIKENNLYIYQYGKDREELAYNILDYVISHEIPPEGLLNASRQDLLIWLDAYDRGWLYQDPECTLPSNNNVSPPDDSSRVGCWKDRNGNIFSSAEGRRPSYRVTDSGQPFVEFNKDSIKDDILVGSGISLPKATDKNPLRVYMVADIKYRSCFVPFSHYPNGRNNFSFRPVIEGGIAMFTSHHRGGKYLGVRNSLARNSEQQLYALSFYSDKVFYNNFSSSSYDPWVHEKGPWLLGQGQYKISKYNFCSMKLMELIVVTGLDDASSKEVEHYLKKKWKIQEQTKE